MTDDRRRQFGMRLRRLREARGLTMKELAEAVSFSYSYIRSLETGVKNPPATDALPRFANALGVTVDELLGVGDEQEAIRAARQAQILDLLEPTIRKEVQESAGTNVPLTERHARGEDDRRVANEISGAGAVETGGREWPIPVLGRIPADTTRWAEWEPMGRTEPIPQSWLGGRSPEQFFILEVSGDCMAARGIHNGSFILCRRLNGDRPDHNKIVVVRIGNEYTLKIWSVEEGRTRLRDGDGNLIVELDTQEDVAAIGVVVRYWGNP